MAGPPSMLKRFRAGHQATLEAFNRGDYETAFAGLPPDFEWVLLPDILDTGVLRGPDEAVAWFRRLRESFPDWQYHPRQYLEGRDGQIAVVGEVGGTSEMTGLSGGQTVVHVYRLRDGLPVSVREFSDQAQALRAAGVPEDAASIPAKPRRLTRHDDS